MYNVCCNSHASVYPVNGYENRCQNRCGSIAQGASSSLFNTLFGCCQYNCRCTCYHAPCLYDTGTGSGEVACTNANVNAQNGFNQVCQTNTTINAEEYYARQYGLCPYNYRRSGCCGR